jgi:hypothetical protein
MANVITVDNIRRANACQIVAIQLKDGTVLSITALIIHYSYYPKIRYLKNGIVSGIMSQDHSSTMAQTH